LKPGAASDPTAATRPTATAGGVAPAEKLERYTAACSSSTSCYVLFRHFLQKFRDKITKLKLHCVGDRAGANDYDESLIWIRSDEYGIDRCNHNIWLGLGRLEGGFRRPVAFKLNDAADGDGLHLARIMRKLKPGSFIASAELVEVAPTKVVESHSDNPQRTPTPSKQMRWMSEAGICTLEEIFYRKLSDDDKLERSTKAHRMLVREILHSMALALFHLHECRIAHTQVSLNFFKLFLIEEPPRSTNLRVKLVSMRKAQFLDPQRASTML
jgi:hypothetical protein